MRKNGFTLIELLAVIVILALLVVLVFPSIINSVKSSSKKTDDLTLELIYNASNLFVLDHVNYFPKENGNKYIIKLNDLVDEGLLVAPIELSDNKDITNDKCVQVTYENGYRYELKDSGTCESSLSLCEVLEVSVQGEYAIGDSYTCELGDGVSRIFYILELGTNSVTGSVLKTNEVALILNENYDDTTQTWCDQTGKNPDNNICNADGLTPKLDEIRNTWGKLQDNQITLPTYNQIYAVNSSTDLTPTPWLFINLNSVKGEDYAPYGYWTSTPSSDGKSAWRVYGTYHELSVLDVDFADSKGIRPVIILSKSSLINEISSE